MWHQNRVEITPIVMSTTGHIPKVLHQYIREAQLQPGIYMQLQKSVVIDTCSMVRKTLNIK